MIKLTKIINITILTLILNWINVGYCEETKDVAKQLQEIAVTIKAGGSSGSGVIFTRKDTNNNFINFVWTAGHVVKDLRSERELITSDGSKKTVVEFQDPKIVKILIEDGRIVGTLEIDCEIIKYSDAENGDDLCIMMARKKGFIKETVKFYNNIEPLPLGTELFHVGSLLGITGGQSLTAGIVSQIGRLVNKKEFDQSTVVAFPGSSGGGLFLKNNGECVGFILRGAGETFNLFIGIRRVKDWAERNRMLWALDQNIPLPPIEEIKAMPIEDKFNRFDFNKNKDNTIKTLENKTNSIENIKILIK